MPKLHRRKVILVKSEANYGSDASPTSTDAVLAIDPAFTLEAEKLPRNYLSKTLSKFEHLIGRKFATLNFALEIKGDTTSAVASTNPLELDASLRACGFRASYEQVGTAPDVSADWVRYYLTDYGFDFNATGFSPVTIYFEQDGVRHKLLGCVGSCNFAFSAGEIPRINFAFSGLWEPAGSIADLTSPTYEETIPIPAFNGTLAYGATASNHITGTALTVQSITFDIGQTVAQRQSIAARYGVAGFNITDREVVGTMNPEFEPSGDAWLWDEFEGETKKGIVLRHGDVNGNKSVLYARDVKLDSIAYAERDGILAQEIPFSVNMSSGADEFVLAIGGSGLY